MYRNVSKLVKKEPKLRYFVFNSLRLLQALFPRHIREDNGDKIIEIGQKRT